MALGLLLVGAVLILVGVASISVSVAFICAGALCFTGAVAFAAAQDQAARQAGDRSS